VFLVFAVGFLAAGRYYFFTSQVTEATVDPADLIAVRKGTMVHSVVATGNVQPISNRVEIMSKASGIVKRIYADVGDRVRKGQVLVELDREQLLAELREAEATRLAAEADLEASLAELRRNQILAEGHDVDLARRDVNRNQALHERGLIANSVLDESQGRLDNALNRQRAAQAEVSVTKAAIAQKKALVTQVQATIERIDEDLNYTRIHSPIDGIVLARGATQEGSGERRSLEEGSAVSSILTMGEGASVVMTLGNMDEVYVRGQVSESDIGLVKVGQPARIRVDAFRDRTFKGKVYKIAPLGNYVEGVTTFEVRVTVENPDGLLLANMSANAEIVLEEHTDTLIVPEGALVYDRNQKAFVDLPDASSPDGRRRVEVELGICNGAECEVLLGIGETDQVILQM
jgi:HlyD family secretion protein